MDGDDGMSRVFVGECDAMCNPVPKNWRKFSAERYFYRLTYPPTPWRGCTM